MLERASTCLETGARLSLRCARRSDTSKRQLHSAFWTHGALDFDTPAFTFDTTFWRDGVQTLRQRREHSKVETKRAEHSKTETKKAEHTEDTGFLDFLYPPKALAWLRHATSSTSAAPQCETWELRNARRLPRGYVHASRRYSSIATARRTSLDAPDDLLPVGDMREISDEGPIDHTIEELGGFDAALEALNQRVENPNYSPNLDSSSDLSRDLGLNYDDPATEVMRGEIIALWQRIYETEVNDSRRFMSFLSIADRILSQTLDARIELTEAAWRLYKALPPRYQNAVGITESLMAFLNDYHTANADNQLFDLFTKLPVWKRSMSMYKTAVTAFMRCGLPGLAEKIHVEALKRLDGAQAISMTLIVAALKNSHWDLAYRAYQDFHKANVDASVQALFWEELAQSGDLLPNAQKMGRYVQAQYGKRPVHPMYWRFCMRFFKVAMLLDLRTSYVAASPHPRRLRNSRHLYLIRVILRFGSTGEARNFLDDMLHEILENKRSNVHFDSAGALTRTLLLASLTRTRPSDFSIATLQNYLTKVIEHRQGLTSYANPWRHLPVALCAEIWLATNGNVTLDAALELMTYYATLGKAEEMSMWTQYYRRKSPDWISINDTAMLCEIKIHATRRNVSGAREAFERLKAEFGEQALPIEYWNALVNALIRGDDIAGAHEVITNMVEEGRLPTSATLRPLFDHMALHGDVEGIEVLLARYERLTGAHDSLPLLTTVVKAMVVNNDLENARLLLRHRLIYLAPQDDLQQLTEAFNIILMGYAQHIGIKGVIRIYKYMVKSSAPVDAQTYAAMAQAYASNHDCLHAYRVLRKAMPREQLQATASHYAIVMGGLLKIGQPGHAIDLYKDFTTRGMRPSIRSDMLYCRALQAQSHDLQEVQAFLRDKLDFLLREYRLDESANPLFLADPGEDASLTDYIASIIEQLGELGQFESIRGYITTFITDNNEARPDIATLPLNMLIALMSANFNSKKWNGVEECYELVKERVSQNNRPQSFTTLMLTAEMIREELERSATRKSVVEAPEDRPGTTAPVAENLHTEEPSEVEQESDKPITEASTIEQSGVEGVQDDQHSIEEPNIEQNSAVETITEQPEAEEPNMEEGIAQMHDSEEQPSEDAIAEQLTPESNRSTVQDIMELTKVIEEDLAARTSAIREKREEQAAVPHPERMRAATLPMLTLRERSFNRAFQYQISMLAQNNDIDRVIATLEEYFGGGYTFDSTTANTVVQACLATKPALVSLAFGLVERFMIKHFRGWTTTEVVRPRDIMDGTQLMWQGKFLISQLRPTYKTLVQLSAAYLALLEAQAARRERSPYASCIGTTQSIKVMAPKTMYALRQMPVTTDEVQQQYLGEHLPDEK